MAEPPSAQAIAEQLKKAGVEFVVRLPDRMTARLNALIERDPSFVLVPVCKEDEGVSICAALSIGDRRAVLLIQHTGFLDSINSIRSVASEMQFPLVMVIGLLLKEPGVRPAESGRFGVRITEPILDTLNIPHVLVDVSGDEAVIAPLIERAYGTSQPAAILIGTMLA